MIPAKGTKIEAIVDRRTVDRFGREGGEFVLGVTRLSPDASSLLTLRRVRLGRLDDVGGRWLRGGRGILPRGELRFETRNGGLTAFNRASWASKDGCKCRQFGQDFLALVFMADYATSLTELTQ